jgi:hypothetical protein
MRVLNVHERDLDATTAEVGRLIDALSSPADVLWPSRHWPAMRFDRPLQVGATGGHGPIRYFVEAYEPGRLVQFRFTGPKGFLGFHALDVQETAPGRALLRHVLEMETEGPAVLTWPLVFRWLHDALLEDALDQAETAVGAVCRNPRARRWSLWVRILRAVLRPRRSRKSSRPTGQTGDLAAKGPRTGT